MGPSFTAFQFLFPLLQLLCASLLLKCIASSFLFIIFYIYRHAYSQMCVQRNMDAFNQSVIYWKQKNSSSLAAQEALMFGSQPSFCHLGILMISEEETASSLNQTPFTMELLGLMSSEGFCLFVCFSDEIASSVRIHTQILANVAQEDRVNVLNVGLSQFLP